MKKALLAAAAAGIFVCLFLAGCGGTATLDLADYAHFDVTGRDGEATASVTLDTSSLETAVVEAVGLGESALQSGTADNDWLLNVVDSISFSLSKTEDISNGDIIAVTAALDAANAASPRVQFKFSDTNVTVTGLDDKIHLDPFENLFVSFSGVEPNVHIDFSVSGSGSFELADSFGYTATPATALSAGDTVVITAECLYDEATLNTMGYTVDTYQRIYTVPGDQDHYAADWQAFSGAALSELLRDAQNAAAGLEYESGALPVYSAGDYLTDARDLDPTDFALGNTFFTVSNTLSTAEQTPRDSAETAAATPEAAAQGDAADAADGADAADTTNAADTETLSGAYQNRLAVIFSCSVTGSEGSPTTLYGAVFLDDLAVDSSGDLSLELDPEITVSPLYLDIPDLMAQQLGCDETEYSQIYFTQEQWAADIETANARAEAEGKTTAGGTDASIGAATGSAGTAAGGSTTGGAAASTPMLNAPSATALPKLDHIG